MSARQPLFEEIGPAIFYTTDAAYAVRARMGGRVFLPEPSNGEIYWFPMRMTPTQILTHRMLTGLSGQLCDGQSSPVRWNLNPEDRA